MRTILGFLTFCATDVFALPVSSTSFVTCQLLQPDLCMLADGTVVALEPKQTEGFNVGHTYEIEISTETTDSSAHMTANGTERASSGVKAAPKIIRLVQQPSSTQEMANNANMSSHRARRLQLQIDYRSTVSLRLQYPDGNPSYCDEACVRTGFQTMSDSFITWSSQKLLLQAPLDNSNNLVFTISMPGRLSNLGRNCYIEQEAEKALIEANKVTQSRSAIRDSEHIEFFFPANFPSCYVEATSYFNCLPYQPGPYSAIETIRRQGACRSFLFSADISARMAAIGRSLGLGLATSYGYDGSTADEAALLGGFLLPPRGSGYDSYLGSSVKPAPSHVRSFSAPELHKTGMMDASALRTINSGEAKVSISAWQFNTLTRAVRVECFACASAGVAAGYLYISFRDSSPDESLPAKFQNKVLLQLFNDNLGDRGSDLLAVLDIGQSFETQHGVGISVCRKPSFFQVEVAVAFGGEARARSLCGQGTAPQTDVTCGTMHKYRDVRALSGNRWCNTRSLAECNDWYATTYENDFRKQIQACYVSGNTCRIRNTKLQCPVSGNSAKKTACANYATETDLQRDGITLVEGAPGTGWCGSKTTQTSCLNSYTTTYLNLNNIIWEERRSCRWTGNACDFNGGTWECLV
mmetsp:Transcript_23049/g.48421  ORF Transcript_23049/g.48421 Transcript_23049/m.48421 type:complete len:638 (-) Transcript_23049:498-2411(-)